MGQSSSKVVSLKSTEKGYAQDVTALSQSASDKLARFLNVDKLKYDRVIYSEDKKGVIKSAMLVERVEKKDKKRVTDKVGWFIKEHKYSGDDGFDTLLEQTIKHDITPLRVLVEVEKESEMKWYISHGFAWTGTVEYVYTELTYNK